MSTVVHGDLWLNNLMLSDKDSDRVKFFDFGNACVSHPAQDLAYLLYMNTDREFRMENTDRILKEYFDVYNSYLGSEFTFVDFVREFEERREGTMLLAMHVRIYGIIIQVVYCNRLFQDSMLVLSPTEIRLNSLWDVFAMDRFQTQVVGGRETEGEHHMIREIRRRLAGAAKDLNDFGFLD